MVCKMSCGIAIAFIVASLYTSYNVDKTQMTQTLMNSLDHHQKEEYVKIIFQRAYLYSVSMVLGVSLAIITLFYLMVVKKQKLSKLHAACIGASVTFVVSYFNYILTPKKTYLVSKLTSKEQIDNWLTIYRTMQLRYHLGFALGLIGVAVGSQAFC